MIAHIQGKIVEKTPTDVVIDCGGVGYHINISLHTYSLLPTTEFIKLYTYLQIKEDAHTLFGFVEKSEREIFKMLLSSASDTFKKQFKFRFTIFKLVSV